eukprot:GHVO01005522.1.p1 GENE.GHVO01005522.1~~GHVO01005522.1.p1  ORF type:complete len:213 (-),score=25.65 GHVO01005522.1:355-993(-)
MHHTLKPLPYQTGALSPFLSKEAIEYHYGKHHRGYVDKLNTVIRDDRFQQYAHLQIDAMIMARPRSAEEVYNNAAQIWNHDFYWSCMSPNKTDMSLELMHAIERDFGSVQLFKNRFKTEAMSRFGSGWAWLIAHPITKALSIVTTPNADTPMTRNEEYPILTCDVWEHAYYVDYRNRRADYIDRWWDVVHWAFLSQRYNNVIQECLTPSYFD